ncbi:PAS domain-containing protein [Bradyrhizobium sp. 83012]|uniref:Blue-light-activated histidine kinase n=1 Tax=Bradyrhizobium aeschynomenes TaxID=2734909 RepID=A0ABX2CMD6_9BRAD|nr:HWE histidine kinase domain-containing protein [Bradyrhizobium aeschynomenes]NPU12560.1 PAS domain-containing protein [Bradyrhizobium aeschynomenes]NPU69361.1 PAS domain-containing protein [Bradyrhizobium aeschynomenes]
MPTGSLGGVLVTLQRSYGVLSIKGRLLLLAGILFLPCVGLIAYVIVSMAQSADASIRRGLSYAAQTISGAVDAELRRYIALAEVLAKSPDLAADDLGQFESEARRVGLVSGDAWIIVSDPSGRLLLNTLAAPGKPLGERTPQGQRSQDLAFKLGRPQVSDIFTGPNSGEWVATVDIPVFKDGMPFRCLSIAMPAANYTRLLAQQQLPADWLVGIMDGSGRYISRIPKNATSTGQPASAGWRASAKVAGIAEFPSIEGDRVINANAHPQLSDWTVGVGIKQGVFAQAISSTVQTATIAATTICALALLLAAGIGRSIARPLDSIAVKSSTPGAAAPSDPPEVRALNARLAAAARAQAESARIIQDNFRLLAKARDDSSRTAEQLKLAAKYGRLGTFSWDGNSNTSQWSDEIEELYGLQPGTFPGTYDAWLALVHPEDQARADRDNKQALITGELHSEWRVPLPDGSVRWIEARARLLRGEGDSDPQMIGVNIDVTAAKEADRKRELLVHELAHRVKNSLAVVQSLAHQLLPRHDVKVRDFTSRLHALATVHTSLSENDWQGADLASLVTSQVAPFASAPDQLLLGGPDILVPVELTTQLALVIHEMACNASKYGALTTPGGRVEVSWSLGPDALHVRWQESGGPPAREPPVVGFGSRLLTRTVRHLQRTFSEGGLICQFELPWLETRSPGADATLSEAK